VALLSLLSSTARIKESRAALVQNVFEKVN
jgi:hypothetical protein